MLTRFTRFVLPFLSVRFIFVVICTSCATFYIWTRLVTVSKHGIFIAPVQKTFDNVSKHFTCSKIYEKPSAQTKKIVFLLWTNNLTDPFFHFEIGSQAFIKQNCSVTNCHVTSDREFFKGNLTKFDAIIFNGRDMSSKDLPKHRLPHQKYIYINRESADLYPICNKTFDGFFNWTSTYRLDSDIPYFYFDIRNTQGEILGPKREMHWLNDFYENNSDFTDRLTNKSKAAAWFVSNCSSRSGREKFVTKLQEYLQFYGYNVDVCGKCGPKRCPKNCKTLLETDYFFYMSLENSFADDYVTENVLTALHHDTVPIVYGGADYYRFLPPGSYINARKVNIQHLAAIMVRLMKSPKIYTKYFRWKSQYTFNKNDLNICEICAALNNKEMVEKITIYDEFRKWWNPYFWKRCGLTFPSKMKYIKH